MVSKRIKLSIEEHIENKEESIKQLQNQKRQLKKKLNEQERLSLIHISSPRDATLSRMPSSA